MGVDHQSADAADLSALAALWGRSGTPTDVATLAWRLHAPAGVGQVWWLDGRAALEVTPLDVVVEGRRKQVLRVRSVGPQPDVNALIAALRQDLPADASLIGLSRTAGPMPTGASALAGPRTWVTGPDPFVPTQPDVQTLGSEHDALGARLAQRAGTHLHVDADVWRWRYQDQPGQDVRLMELPGASGIEGLVAATVEGRLLRVLEIQAVDLQALYPLLKAVRRWSWELGSLPLVLHGGEMCRRYAFTAGYLPAPRPSRPGAWALGPAAVGRWVLCEGDGV